MKELTNKLAKGREYCDDAFKMMHDAVRDIIVKAGGYINTANNDGKNDNIYSAVIDYCGAGELVEVEVKALKVENGLISCYVQPISFNTKTIYDDDFMKADEDNWYWLDNAGDLLYHYTLLNIADVFEFGEYLPSEE
jgi:hypothetical protein